MTKPYRGYNTADLSSDLAAFYVEPLADIPETTRLKMSESPLPWGALPGMAGLPQLEQPGYLPVETGYAEAPDGSIAVAVKTPMPGVTPQMWDWWFGWHSSQDLRYKLWHPSAHLSARWQDGESHIGYVGRTSIVVEYIGENLLEAAVRFKSPLNFGFSHETVGRPDKAVYICAKLGHPTLPVDYGYLVHQVRATPDGAEMRSRFFLGGQFVSVNKTGKLATIALEVLKKLKKLPQNFAHDLMHHCAEEMNHLAAVLPRLYARYANQEPPSLTGVTSRRGDPDFDRKIMSTLFNKVDPGQRPDMIVEPKTVEDVISIVRYAKSVGKRITISSGGHSFSANFIRNDAILVLMKHFNQYEVNVDDKTATAGPGVGGSVLMKGLFKRNLFFPAGHCKGVCIGGYLLQGGYGWNGRKLGIACQSVIGMDIVTADGDFVHASPTQNADLFWAARGSGPGFFGIVTKFYLRLYDLPKYRAIMAHEFPIQYLEEVYRWAYEVGPEIPKAVEFQMIMSKKMLNVLGPGIEALAPIFADTKEEFEEAQAFMINSPIRKKAVVSLPAFDPGIEMLYKAAMSHYPSNYHWGVDNMWTHASIDELLPYIKTIAETLPPAPSHFLWLNWHPGSLDPGMAYSKEDKIYMALYSCWKNKQDTPVFENWAAEMMKKMQHLGVGIQLADEGLHKRTAAFLSDENLLKVQEIRSKWDSGGLFYEWHSKPELT